MADKERDPTIVAIESVYSALKDLDQAERRKVLASAFALLGLEAPTPPPPSHQQPESPKVAPSSSARPTSLIELMDDKKPGTNSQRIAVFAYYREKIEGIARFARADLAPYFAKAKLTPASNFDRDFVEAVRKGWIHEDGGESYLTTKGIEAIESNFEGGRNYSNSSRRASSPRKSKPGSKKKALKRRGAG